ncbi:claudin-23-like [Astyanax mexicanus]|uniref:Claudin-23-like n=3 Tax=Astyanax mexicanus TaxID=7994 RepID=A0A8B9LHN4_ASTMX|nr:claudin-23-like [Astyanax mexicanus]
MRPSGMMMHSVVLALSGWILNLASTISPNWRTLHNVTGEQPDVVLQQGIWDICWNIMKNGQKDMLCSQQNQNYFNSQIIITAQWMMVVSLGASIVGLVVVIGAHIWMKRLRWLVAGLGGFIISCSGAAAIVPAAWYAYLLNDIPSPGASIRLGHCIVLGCIGGFMEVLSGFIVFVGFCQSYCWQGDNGEDTTPESIYKPNCRRISREGRIPYVRHSQRDVDNVL